MGYFTSQAKLYAEFRPDYPAALFEFIAAAAPGHALAWDCATGSGQAATGLADHFQRVIATDASEAQIAHARPHPRIEYRVAPAEASGLPDHCADAITVTQALHWLKFEPFFAEVRRVAKPNALFIATVYSDPVLEDPAANAILHNYNKVVVGPHWPPERKFVDERYESIPIPFAPIQAPTLRLEKNWTLAELAGYLRSWSATVRCTKATGSDPVIEFERAMRQHWPHPDQPRHLCWPFTILASRVQSRDA
jgi:SAM-dependent methyltransferase